MHTDTITTGDGITLHLVTGATLWHHADTGGESSVTDIAAIQAQPIEDRALNSGRGWEYVSDQPWTWQTSPDPYHQSMPAAAGFDPADQTAVDAATAWVAHRVRRTLADQSARRTYTDRERARATAEAARLRPRIVTGGGSRAMDAREKLRVLHRDLISRGLLDAEEIDQITGLDYVPGLPGYGMDRPRIMYGPAEVAIRAGIARGTVDRYIADGRLPLEDAPRLWEPEAIEAWLDDRR